MKISLGVSELWRFENRPLPLTWPKAYITVQAVICLFPMCVACDYESSVRVKFRCDLTNFYWSHFISSSHCWTGCQSVSISPQTVHHDALGGTVLHLWHSHSCYGRSTYVLLKKATTTFYMSLPASAAVHFAATGVAAWNSLSLESNIFPLSQLWNNIPRCSSCHMLTFTDWFINVYFKTSLFIFILINFFEIKKNHFTVKCLRPRPVQIYLDWLKLAYTFFYSPALYQQY